MATLVAQRLNLTTAAKPTLGAAALSDKYPAGPGKFALISVGATATTITVVDPRVTALGASIPDFVLPSATSVDKYIPLPLDLADADGYVTITCSQIASVTCAAIDAY